MPATESQIASLASGHDILSLGALADDMRRQLHGTRVTFVRVADVAAVPGAPVSIPGSAREIRLIGTPLNSETAIARVREIAPATGAAALSGFLLSDLEDIAAREDLTLRALLEHLRDAGLELVAEAALDKLRDRRRSIEQVNIAGLALARLTIHDAPAEDPIDLMKEVAALQHSVAVIRAFAPLPRGLNPAAPTTGYDDVKRVALARLYVQNVPSIQVDWSLYGPKLAQVALTMGADDLDAVSPVNDEGAHGPRRTPFEEVRRNIIAAGFEPVERDGRFEPLPR